MKPSAPTARRPQSSRPPRNPRLPGNRLRIRRLSSTRRRSHPRRVLRHSRQPPPRRIRHSSHRRNLIRRKANLILHTHSRILRKHSRNRAT